MRVLFLPKKFDFKIANKTSVPEKVKVPDIEQILLKNPREKLRNNFDFLKATNLGHKESLSK